MATPTLQNVKDYLGENAYAYSDVVLTSTLAAETAAQAAVCRVGEAMPDDLAMALLRRVARNLAMRALPVGVQSDEMGSTTIGSNDPEVRRLEKPYKKVFVG